MVQKLGYKKAGSENEGSDNQGGGTRFFCHHKPRRAQSGKHQRHQLIAATAGWPQGRCRGCGHAAS
eukprot:9404538-Prorocentrum_lima.AAC.1